MNYARGFRRLVIVLIVPWFLIWGVVGLVHSQKARDAAEAADNAEPELHRMRAIMDTPAFPRGRWDHVYQGQKLNYVIAETENMRAEAAMRNAIIPPVIILALALAISWVWRGFRSEGR